MSVELVHSIEVLHTTVTLLGDAQIVMPFSYFKQYVTAYYL